MDTKSFNELYKFMEERVATVSSVSQTFSKLLDEGIENFTFKQYTTMREVGIKELSYMDKLNSDVYHIIGMSKMSASQLSKYLKLHKTYLQNRNTIKRLASFPSLPSMPNFKKTEVTYTCVNGFVLKGKS